MQCLTDLGQLAVKQRAAGELAKGLPGFVERCAPLIQADLAIWHSLLNG
jgi:hypothetical protein